MENQAAAGFGPVLFVGLTFAALVTHTPPNPDLPNPQETATFDAEPDIDQAAPPEISVPALRTDIAVLPIEASLRPTASRLEAALAARPMPVPIEVASYPDLPDSFAGYLETTAQPVQVGVRSSDNVQKLTPPSIGPATAHGTHPGIELTTPTIRVAISVDLPEFPTVQTVSSVDPQTRLSSNWMAWVRSAAPAPTVAAKEAQIIGPSPKAGWHTVDGNFVNMRAAPDLNADRVEQYFRGNRLIVTEQSEGWARVNEPSNPPKTGWMSVEFLVEDSP